MQKGMHRYTRVQVMEGWMHTSKGDRMGSIYTVLLADYGPIIFLLLLITNAMLNLKFMCFIFSELINAVQTEIMKI